MNICNKIINFIENLSGYTFQTSAIYKLNTTNIGELRAISPELIEAAKNGDPNAFEKFGDMFKEGNGVEKNPKKAMELYEIAIQLGREKAEREATALVNNSTVRKELKNQYEEENDKQIDKTLDVLTRRLTREIEKSIFGEHTPFRNTRVEDSLYSTYHEMLQTDLEATYEHILREATDGNNKVAQFFIADLNPDTASKIVHAFNDGYMVTTYLLINMLKRALRQGHEDAFRLLASLYEGEANKRMSSMDGELDIQRLMEQTIEDNAGWAFDNGSSEANSIYKNLGKMKYEFENELKEYNKISKLLKKFRF